MNTSTPNRFRLALRGLLTGAVCGGIPGAVIFGLSNYFDTRSGFLGSGRDWALAATLIGLVCGSGVGGILGMLIGAANADRRSSVIIGTGIGLPLAASFFTGGSNTYMQSSTGMVALGMIVFCMLLGWGVASILQRQRGV